MTVRGVSREAAIADYGVVLTGEPDEDLVSYDAAATDAARATRPALAEVFFDRGPGYSRLSGGVSYAHRRRGGLVTTWPSTDKAAALLALHAGPGSVLPNAWDAGSARILEQVGFPAIATNSAGIAWSCGVPDGEALDCDRMLEHVGRIVAAVDVPVTADLEAGYGDTADDVSRTVARAVELGAAGGNLEDAGKGGLFGIDEAVDRLAAAQAAAPSGTFVLNARTDTYFAGTSGDAFAETVERAVRYVEAGADCVFVPGVVEEDTIRRLAAAIPGPLNVVAGLANLIDAPTLFSLGVKRVSLGGSLARAALSMLERAGRELLDSGTLGFLDGAIGYADLQRRFGS
jgi:2-methylisocitrate lyase-like PEP mutase family enzyme